jgi:hypothetical protein
VNFGHHQRKLVFSKDNILPLKNKGGAPSKGPGQSLDSNDSKTKTRFASPGVKSGHYCGQTIQGRKVNFVARSRYSRSFRYERSLLRTLVYSPGIRDYSRVKWVYYRALPYLLTTLWGDEYDSMLCRELESFYYSKLISLRISRGCSPASTKRLGVYVLDYRTLRYHYRDSITNEALDEPPLADGWGTYGYTHA